MNSKDLINIVGLEKAKDIQEGNKNKMKYFDLGRNVYFNSIGLTRKLFNIFDISDLNKTIEKPR